MQICGINTKKMTHTRVYATFSLFLLVFLFFLRLRSGVSGEEFLLYICRNELVGIECHGEGSTTTGEGAEGR